MTYTDFLKLSRVEQNACLDAFLVVLFADKAKDASQHLLECEQCREMYANKFADFMTEERMN